MGRVYNHLSCLLSPAFRRGGGPDLGAYIQCHVPELQGPITRRCEDLILVDLGPRNVVQTILRFIAENLGISSTANETKNFT